MCDPNLSSDSSWTLIEDSASQTKKQGREEVKVDIPQDSEATDAGFLTFDEYYLENGGVKPQRRKKKCKAEQLNLFSILACLLTITGLTLLTTLIPPNVETAAVAETTAGVKLAQDLKGVIESADVDMFSMMREIVGEQNLTDEDVCSISFDATTEPLAPTDVDQNVEDNTDDSGLKQSPVLEMLTKVLTNGNLQIFLATLVQDLCLIKVLNEFSKRSAVRTSKKSTGKTKKVKASKTAASLEKKKVKETKPKSTVPCPTPIVLPNMENGKSECERRFEQLENEWQNQPDLDLSKKTKLAREAFFESLKTDREVYLSKLKKLREEKMMLVKGECAGSTDSTNVEEPPNTTFYKNLQLFRSKEQIQNQHDRYWRMKRRYIQKKTKLLRKRQQKNDAKEVREVIRDMVNNVAENMNKTPVKRHIYDLAFEKNSKRAKQMDIAKWNNDPKNWKVPQQRVLMSKQDPQKSYSPNILQ